MSQWPEPRLLPCCPLPLDDPLPRTGSIPMARGKRREACAPTLQGATITVRKQESEHEVSDQLSVSLPMDLGTQKPGIWFHL